MFSEVITLIWLQWVLFTVAYPTSCNPNCKLFGFKQQHDYTNHSYGTHFGNSCQCNKNTLHLVAHLANLSLYHLYETKTKTKISTKLSQK